MMKMTLAHTSVVNTDIQSRFKALLSGNMLALHDTSPATDLHPLTAAAVISLFFLGWVLTRGANLQKYAFKRNPRREHFMFVRQVTLPGSRLLVSGWWGLARHINYLGEIMQVFIRFC